MLNSSYNVRFIKIQNKRNSKYPKFKTILNRLITIILYVFIKYNILTLTPLLSLVSFNRPVIRKIQQKFVAQIL